MRIIQFARRIGTVALSLLTGGALALSMAAPAAAGNFNGSCESGEFCLYYYRDFGGAKADFYDEVSNYSNWHFWNSSLWLNDNAMSADNNAFWSCGILHEHANFSGNWDSFDPNEAKGSLGTLNNKVSSHGWAIPMAPCL